MFIQMAPLTPAQKAVLERIEKKKELQKKTAMKRKAKTDPVPDTTVGTQRPTLSLKIRARLRDERGE